MFGCSLSDHKCCVCVAKNIKLNNRINGAENLKCVLPIDLYFIYLNAGSCV